MRLSAPFIRLPFAFDAARLAAEAEALPASAWRAHPSAMRGNSAVALISSGGGDNDAFDGEKKATPHLAACPYTRQAMASFEVVLSRSRFMKLEAGCEVSLHVDFNYHWFSRVRIHIPVVTAPGVVFHCGAAALHMAAGECWLFDSWRRHRVANDSPGMRIHLVIDTAGSAEFWRRVAAAEAMPADAAAREAQAVAFEPGSSPRLLLERYSESAVMAPGECDALVADLIADFLANPANDPQLAQAYAKLLRGFAQDWRALWLRFGEEPAARPRYLALIAATRRQLHPNRRALTTASNGIGVNAVFAQRVLNAALRPT